MTDVPMFPSHFATSTPYSPLPGCPQPQARFGIALHSRIGPYQLTRFLGAGGMGAVFEAELVEPNHPGPRQVAIKVIASDHPTHDDRQRFLREAQAVGHLDHPAIARVYAAGVHAEEGPLAAVHAGTPYLALELVRSATDLASFCDHFLLALTDRLALFDAVADAIVHAHSRGVIHRDLKVENILVDHDARVKLIDFGVAHSVRTLGGRGVDGGSRASRLTRVGHWVGTLTAMAPEQLESDPHRVDARCDVYALGAVLYHLATGRPAHDLSRAPSPAAAARIVRRLPLRPSRINPRIGADLESVILHALHRDPERRCSSAAALRDDLRRVRAGLRPEHAPRATSSPWSAIWQRARILAGLSIAS